MTAEPLAAQRPPLFPNVRRSPYFERTQDAGALEFMVYNHMYMPIVYARDPRAEYEALQSRVCLWDVGAERQTELRGPDAVRFANHLCTRDLRELAVGRCRFTMVCDHRGAIMTEPIVLRPWEDVVWISHGDVDLTLWARGLAAGQGFDVTVSEPDVAPMQVQGPKSLELLRELSPDVETLGYYHCTVTRVAGVDAVVSRTGWNKNLGFEVYPLDDAGALRIWDAVVEAGAPHDLMIAGPNLSLAVEQGITDNHYYVNSGMTPFEAGAGRLVDLDSAPFVGSDALAAPGAAEPERHTMGLLLEGPPGRMEAFWPIEWRGAAAGEVRWAAYSYALEREIAIAILPRACAAGEEVVVHAPAGAIAARVASVPLVG
jgi:glycine cleavage system aminomethyltransferase T